MDIETDLIQLEKDFFYLLSLKRPFLTRRLYHAVMEALEGVRVNVENYKKDDVFKSVEKNEITRVIHFQLHLLKGRWFPVIRSIDKDKNPYEIMPQALIDYISENAGENVIPWKKPLTVIGIETPVYVSFSKERDDSTIIVGTIEPASVDDSLNEAESITDNIESNQDDLRLFLEHLFKYPEFYKSVMRDFRLKWKPLLETAQEKDQLNEM